VTYRKADVAEMNERVNATEGPEIPHDAFLHSDALCVTSTFKWVSAVLSTFGGRAVLCVGTDINT